MTVADWIGALSVFAFSLFYLKFAKKNHYILTLLSD